MSRPGTETDHLPTWTPSRRWDEGPVLACLAALVLAALWAGLTLSPTPPEEGSVAVGFARDMKVHHEQAVTMAEIMRDRTDDPELRLLATDIALTQQAQIGRMQGWLGLWGLNQTSSDPAMAWMGQPTEGLMPGMATRAMVQALDELPVEEAERRFLSLMIDHHRAGVVMAEAALDHELPDAVATLAEAIVVSQRSEVEVMRTMLAERGVSAPPPSAISHGEGHASGDHHGGLAAIEVLRWAFPAAAVLAIAWLATDAGRRRRAWVGEGQGVLLDASLVVLASASSAGAGLLHLALTPVHLQTGVAAGGLFLVGGLAQLGLAGALWAWPRRELVTLLGTVSAALIATYVLFRVVAPPGASSPEGVDGIGLAVQALQLLVVAAAVLAVRRPAVRLR